MKTYKKSELINELDNLSIERTSNLIITKYKDKVIKTEEVSGMYEIFDIVSYMKDKIDIIENNFNIHKYELNIYRGIQYLKLISEKINIKGVEFYKSFFILNSTDRSRKLNFSVGLWSKSEDFYIVNNVNNQLVRKHVKGVTEKAEEHSIAMGDELFEDQIRNIESIMGKKIKLSNVRKVILGEKEETPKINHKKFDAFKNIILHGSGFHLDREQRKTLLTKSEELEKIPKNVDFYLDAFWVFQKYMNIFKKQDAHVVGRETEKIMKMTSWAVLKNKLKTLGIS